MLKRPLDQWLGTPDDETNDAAEDDEQSNSDVIETIEQAYERVRTRVIPKGATSFTENGIRDSTRQNSGSLSLNGSRRMIYTLLPAEPRRRLFFEMASSEAGLLRLRTCFGAPPYAFLHPSDIHALNAGAIGIRRTHLAYEYGSPIPPYGQVGHVLTDQHGNSYSIVPRPRESTDAAPLPLVLALNQGVMSHFTLQIALKKGEFVPDPRRDLELHETPYHWRVRGRPPRAVLRVKILAIHTSGARRRTAVLTTRLLSASTDDTYGGNTRKQPKPSDKSEHADKRSDSTDNNATDKPERGPTLVDDVPPMPDFVQVS